MGGGWRRKPIRYCVPGIGVPGIRNQLPWAKGVRTMTNSRLIKFAMAGAVALVLGILVGMYLDQLL
jgi:hypothetical protein